MVKGNPEKVEIIEKAGYSHMLIPVDREGTLVISLHGSTFSLYYMNALYAFFITSCSSLLLPNFVCATGQGNDEDKKIPQRWRSGSRAY